MDVLTTDKTWNELLPEASVQGLLDAVRKCEVDSGTLNDTGGGLACTVLLYGASPDNKVAAAVLLSRELKMTAHRVDLSAIVSRHIAETENELSVIFSDAEKNNWLLFFDEADALFGKRTGVKDAHDKYANQETNYLLSMIQRFGKPVLLGIRHKDHVPAILVEASHTAIHFPG